MYFTSKWKWKKLYSNIWLLFLKKMFIGTMSYLFNFYAPRRLVGALCFGHVRTSVHPYIRTKLFSGTIKANDLKLGRVVWYDVLYIISEFQTWRTPTLCVGASMAHGHINFIFSNTFRRFCKYSCRNFLLVIFCNFTECQECVQKSNLPIWSVIRYCHSCFIT